MDVQKPGETSLSDRTEMLRGDYRPESRSGGLRPAQVPSNQLSILHVLQPQQGRQEI